MPDRCKDIVIKGYSGSRGAAFLASLNKDKINHRFRPDYLERELSALDAGGDTMTAYPEGILRGLYDLAMGMKCGMKIELRKIPIRQFTIEVCELCGANPYRIASDQEIELLGNGDGSEGERRAKELLEQGIPAAYIGSTTKGLDKVITDKTNIEYINKE